MDIFQKVSNILKKKEIQYILNQPLAQYSSFKVGGSAKLYVSPSSFVQFKILQKIIINYDLPFFFLGGGSNLLISDDGFDGIVIHLSTPEKIIIKKQTSDFLCVRGWASNRSAWFAKVVSKMGYSGLEFLSTIPGSLGGAIVQNAGCYDSEIKDFIKKIFVIIDGIPKVFQKRDAHFAYRDSIFKKDNRIWIYAVDFMLNSDNLDRVNKQLEKFKRHRIISQPKNKRSAGSIFRNPKHLIDGQLKAWRLIDQVGLRGKQIGGAIFSEEHCNFIVNKNDAKASDISQLILLAQKKVKEKTGIQLETEVVRVGNFLYE